MAESRNKGPAAPRQARLFRNDKRQAIRIPADVELPEDRVTIHRDGGKLIIEPARRRTLVEVLESSAQRRRTT